MCGNACVSPVDLHRVQHELLTERSCFVNSWSTKLGRYLGSLSMLTCFFRFGLFSGGSSNHSEITSLISHLIHSCPTNLNSPQGGGLSFSCSASPSRPLGRSIFVLLNFLRGASISPGCSASPSGPPRRSIFVSLTLPYKWSCGGVGGFSLDRSVEPDLKHEGLFFFLTVGIILCTRYGGSY